MVHAYLMYGYPTQTVQETIDSLEMVRQLFELGVLQSGFWHQFAMTAHSPVGMFPEEYGVIPEQNEITFANNDVNFKDKTGINHDQFSFGLKKALFNYMHGICFDYDLQEWFDFDVPNTTIDPDFIFNALQEEVSFELKPNYKVFWTGSKPSVSYFTKTKKGTSWEMMQLDFHTKSSFESVQLEKNTGEWVLKTMEECSVYSQNHMSIAKIKADYESIFEDFEIFWFSKNMNLIKKNGLLVIN